MRVDALDHRGQWFAGTVSEAWRVDPEELEALRQVDPSLATGLPRETGLHLRVHFDNFSSKWDEWFGPKDFTQGSHSFFHSI
jgi:hypothetical protein